jgi:hypothetical protein
VKLEIRENGKLHLKEGIFRRKKEKRIKGKPNIEMREKEETQRKRERKYT